MYPTGRLSLAGKLTMALFDMVLMDFDHEFLYRFPGIECNRFIDEVDIAIKCGDRHMNEDEFKKDILKFLNEMDIEGKIESTRAGLFLLSRPLIDKDTSKVTLCCAEECDVPQASDDY